MFCSGFFVDEFGSIGVHVCFRKPEALTSLKLSWQRAMEVQKSSKDPCTYRGLSVLQPHMHTAVLGLRVASLCLWIITSAMPMETYESMMHWIDTWFPGNQPQQEGSRVGNSLWDHVCVSRI